MNKTIALLAAGLFAAGSCSAQTALQTPYAHRNPKAESAFQLLQAQLAATQQQPAAKTAGTGYRLTAGSTWMAFGTGLSRTDSVEYHYGAGRGSAFNHDDLYYSNYYSILTSQGLPHIGFDTALHFDYTDNLSYGAVNLRNGAGRVVQQGSFGPFNDMMSLFEYDAQGRMTEDRVRNFDASSNSWVDARRHRYTYNAQGLMVIDTYQISTAAVWQTISVIQTMHNATGLPVMSTVLSTNGTSLVPDYRVKSTYTAVNKIQTYAYEYYNGIGYTPDTKDSIGYTGTTRTFYQSDFFNGVGWERSFVEFRHLNGAGLADDVTGIYYDPSNITTDTSRKTFIYNSQNNPVVQSTYMDGMLNRQEFYHYSEYQTTAVKNAALHKAIAVYPNPATAILSVRPVTCGMAIVNVVNAAGQTVLFRKLQAVAGQTVGLPVEDLLPGQYWLLLHDAGGEQYSATFIKK